MVNQVYESEYSKKLSKTNDFLVNRNAIFKKAVKELGFKPSDKILEIGCDKGYFVNILRDKFDAIGIDLNKDAIAAGVCKNLFFMDITNNNLKDKSFNKIYSFHVVEHIQDLPKFFSEIDRILASKGKVVLVYPFEPIRGIFALRTAIKNRISPRKLHVHSLTPGKIKNYIKKTTLIHKKSSLLFLLIPQFLTVLEKQ